MLEVPAEPEQATKTATTKEKEGVKSAEPKSSKESLRTLFSSPTSISRVSTVQTATMARPNGLWDFMDLESVHPQVDVVKLIPQTAGFMPPSLLGQWGTDWECDPSGSLLEKQFPEAMGQVTAPDAHKADLTYN